MSEAEMVGELEMLELEFQISRVMQLSKTIAENVDDEVLRRPASFALLDLVEPMSLDKVTKIMMLLACQAQGITVLRAETEED